MPKLAGFAATPVPGPAPSRLLGHYPALLRFFDNPLLTLEALRPYGDVVALARDNPAFVVAFGPERNRDVLSNPQLFRNDEEFVPGKPGSPTSRLRKAMVTVNGEEHKRHRRLMMPAFSKSALAGYAEDVIDVATQQVDAWTVGEVVDLDAEIRRIALSVAMRTFFGVELNRDTREIGDILTGFIDAFSAPLAILLPYEVPGSPHRRAQMYGRRLGETLDELIARKRREGADDTDALARLVHAVDDDGTAFTDEELFAEATTLFVAGHDTMAKTMSWTLFMLDRHPEVFAGVLDELDAVIGDRRVSVDDIANLPLLDRVIKETMRVASSVPLLFLRVPTQDVELGGVRLPKDANVVVSPFATHRDPALYERPRRFEPERWTGPKPGTYAYMPFGAGPRSCVGGSFAHQALRLILPTILQRVRPALVHGADVSYITRANIMRPRNGLMARLDPAGTRGNVRAQIGGNHHEIFDL